MRVGIKICIAAFDLGIPVGLVLPFVGVKLGLNLD